MSYLTLSTLGLYNQDPTILDAEHLLIPEGVNLETLQTLILTETAELEVMYPEPVTMAAVVKAWSTARKPSWERMLAALTEEYNPLHNYDRHETEEHDDTDTDDDTGTVTRQKSGTEASAKTGTEANARTGTERLAKTGTISFEGEQANGGTQTGAVAGYNGTAMADKDQTTTATVGTDAGTTTHNTTDTTTHGTTDTITHNTTDTITHNTTDTETRNLFRERTNEGSRSLHAYGNIGLTTSAQMLTGELEVRKTDIYRIICDEFTRYFCLLVY